MPKAARYVLLWSAERGTYALYEQDNSATPLLQGGGEAWFAWLATRTSFSFRGRAGSLTLLKEARKNKGEGYWYAYRRQGKRTAKHYVGRSADLTMARLEEVARILAEPAPAATEPIPVLLEPKLRLPHLHMPLVSRERLLALLDSGLQRKLTLLTAPAGFGKTTLVRQWIADRSVRRSDQEQFPPVAWLSLDAGDNDPVRFWRYVITTCEIWQGGLGQSALAMLATMAQPPFKPPPLEVALTMFLNALTQSKRGVILVLEDYHVIVEPRVHETVSFMLEHLPTTLRLVILARGEPALPIARLRADGDLCEVHAGDLRFSSQETQTFLQQNMTCQPSTLSEEVMKQIETRLEGWAAGLRLLTLALQGRVTSHEVEYVLTTFTGSHRPLLDYFVTQVLDAQPEQLQHFLLQTSILSRLTGPLCDALTGRQDSELLLDALERANLFLEIQEETEHEYRYHALFAEAMQAEARRRLGKDTLRALFQRASQWYKQQGMFAEAIEAAFNAEDVGRAAGLIEQFITETPLFASIEPYILRRWLEQIPSALMREHPTLCLSYATMLVWSLGPQSPGQATFTMVEELLLMAEEGLRARGDTARLGRVFSFRALLLLRLGQLERAIASARQALVWLPAEDMSWRGISLNIVGVGELNKGRPILARKIFLEIDAIWEATGNTHAARSTTVMLGMVHFERGELHLAAGHFQRALNEARAVGDLEDSCMAQLGLAQLFYEWNDLQAAEQAAQEAFGPGGQFARQLLQVRAAILLVDIAHAQGQFSLAQQRLAALLARLLPHREPLLYQEVLACQARLQLAGGDIVAMQRCLSVLAQYNKRLSLQPIKVTSGQSPEAPSLLDEAVTETSTPLVGEQWDHSIIQPGEDFAHFIHEQEELLVARLLLAQGKAEEAQELLTHLLEAACEAGRTRSTMEIQALMILAYAARKQVLEARQSVAGG